MILENIRLAFSSMAQSKMRTLLSLLGIVIGVTSVVAILNLGESATDSMMESLSSGGLDMLTITPRGAARETEIFTDEFPDTLMRNVSGIRTVLPVLSSAASIRNGQEVLSGCSVQGVTSSFFEENALEAYDGAFFTLRDNPVRYIRRRRESRQFFHMGVQKPAGGIGHNRPVDEALHQDNLLQHRQTQKLGRADDRCALQLVGNVFGKRVGSFSQTTFVFGKRGGLDGFVTDHF